MTDNPKLVSLLELLGVLRRQWWVLVAGVCLGLASGIILYGMLPKVYEATTAIFVAPSQIPESYVRSTVTEDMSVRLRSLQESVLSRPNLVRLAEEVFSSSQTGVDREALLRRIRTHVGVELREYDSRRGAGLFVLTYRDQDPELAARVVNQLADSYIAGNVKLRTEQAESTAQTLSQLAAEVRSQLQVKEKELAEYRSRHLYELGENLDANLRLLESRQADLDRLEKTLAQAEDHLRTLQLQREGVALLPDGSQAVKDPLVERIQQVRQEIAALLTRCTEQHPDVRARRAELADLRRQLAERDSGTASGDGISGSPERTRLNLEIDAAQREIERLRQQRDKLRREAAVYRRRVENSPKVEQRLSELMKGYNVLQERYQKYQRDFEEAKGSLRIEQSRKGSQFEIVERAVPPSVPASPDWVLVYGGGLLLGLGLFVGPLAVKHWLRPPVLSRQGIELLTDVPVLETIPLVEFSEVRKSNVARWTWNMAASLVCLAVLVVVFLFFRGGGTLP